jgi:hypothetical protein
MLYLRAAVALMAAMTFSLAARGQTPQAPKIAIAGKAATRTSSSDAVAGTKVPRYKSNGRPFYLGHGSQSQARQGHRTRRETRDRGFYDTPSRELAFRFAVQRKPRLATILMAIRHDETPMKEIQDRPL